MKSPKSPKHSTYARAVKATRPAPTEPAAADVRSAYADGDAPSPTHTAPFTGDQELTPTSDRDIYGALVEIAEADGLFTTLARALRAADVRELLGGRGPDTFFAPTDRAFGRLPEGQLAELLEDKAELRRLLAHHLVRGRIDAPSEDGPTTVTTEQGSALTITKDGTAFRVNGAKVVKPHIQTANGVVRAIDAVLLSR